MKQEIQTAFTKRSQTPFKYMQERIQFSMLSPNYIELFMAFLITFQYFVPQEFVYLFIFKFISLIVIGILLKYQKSQFLLERIILNVRLLSKEIVERNSGYEFDYLKEPIEYSSFIIFKQILILIWVNETVSYCLFVLKYAKDDIYTYTSAIYDLISSNDLTFIFHTILKISLNVKYLQQIGGILIVFLNIYFIKEIYNNEDPYLHFYGNFFFTKNTTRKLNTVPHPLYSIGNIGYYGSALITQSYTVLLVGLVCHALQIIFLYIVIRPEQAMLETKELENDERLHVYINKDLYIFMNFDLFRGGDFLTFLIVGYTVISAIMIGPIDTLAKKKFYMGQALFFRIIHTLGMFYLIGIGAILYKQAKTKFWTRHFLKRGYSLQDAFQQWKILFNLTLTMTYVTFIILFYQLYQPTARYLLLNTIGVLFIVIHIWISLSVYEVLGLKAMFHYDFFLDVKDKKKYSQLGIYKYWRHPMLYTFSCWGMVLISSSWDLFWVTCFGQVCNYIFLLVVEKPHLEQVYGIGLEAQEEKNLEDDTLDSISEDLFTDPTILFSIGNEDSEDSESEKSEPSRSSLVQKTFEKLEGFVNDTAKPHMQTIIQKTRRSVVTLANHAKLEDSLSLKDLPLDLYGIKFTKPPQNGELIYELGEQIEIEFTGCRETMKQKDWIGIYPTNSNPDKSLTTVSSQNKWLTICGNTTTKDLQQLLFYKTNKIDYCGETVVEISKSVYPGLRTVKGNILFKKHHLPWKTGVYEFRYHYDEKYEVLAISVPIRIIIKVPERVDLNRITQEEFTDLLRYNIKRSLDLDDLELFEDHKSLLEMVKVPEDITGIY